MALLTRPARWIILGAVICALVVGFAFVRAEQKAELLSDGGIVRASVVAQRPTQPLPSDLMCFDVNSVLVPSWHSAPFLAAVEQLHPQVLRIPGGELANYWDWQRGGIIEDDAQLPDGLPEYMRYEARDYTGSQIKDYSAGLHSTGTTALFVLNMLTSDLAEQIDMLSAAARSGIEIKYIELGNEYFFGIPNYVEKFPTPEAYGETAKIWMGYLRDIFPGVEIAVFGAVPEPTASSPREDGWNQALLQTALPSADAIALHFYPRPGLDPNGFSETAYPAFDEADFATVLGEPFRHWQGVRDRPSYKLIPADKEIWITEFNLLEDIFGENVRRPRVMGTWAHGLYALAMNLTYLEDPRVTLTCNHDLVEDFKFGAILPREDSFQVSLEQTFPVVPLTLSATGQALQLLGDTAAGMSKSQPLQFASQPRLSGKGGFTYSALYGWRFERDNAAGAVVLNLSNSIVELNIADIALTGADYQQLSGDPRILVTGPTALTTRRGIATAVIALAPHSVTQLRLAS